MTEITKASATVVVRQKADRTAAVEEDRTVVVRGRGSPGPEGPVSTVPGPQGPQGPRGAAGSAPQAYIHVQNTPDTTWDIPHYLGFVPNARVEDSAGTQHEVDTEIVDLNNLRVHILGGAFAGTAYLS